MNDDDGFSRRAALRPSLRAGGPAAQFRAYTRGQWTVHRNAPRVNRLYRACSHMSQRLVERLERHAHYESGEGCYSFMLANMPEVRIRYAVKALTDASGHDATGKEAYLVDGEARTVLFVCFLISAVFYRARPARARHARISWRRQPV